MWFLISFCLAGSNCFHPSSDIKRSETSLRPFFAALETKSKHISAGFLESVFASLHLKVNLCVSLELQSGSVSGGVSVVELANMWSLLWLLPDFVFVRSRFRVCCCTCVVCTSQGVFVHGSSESFGISVEISKYSLSLQLLQLSSGS